MKTIKNYQYKTDNLPFNKVEVVSDLKYYDGPIMTHFISETKKNYISCWVDDDDTSYRWLIFNLLEENLYNYLSNKKDLKTIFDETPSDFIYLADITNNTYSSVSMLTMSQLDDEYIPEKADFFGLEFPKKYQYLKEKYENQISVTKSSLSKFGLVAGKLTDTDINTIRKNLFSNSIFFSLQPNAAA